MVRKMVSTAGMRVGFAGSDGDSMNFGFGELAALITSASWAGSCQVHTMASRMIGAFGVVVARVPLLVFALGLIALFAGASTEIPGNALFFVFLSGVVGPGFADTLLYRSSMAIGPRLAVLLISLSSCMTALLGDIFLGESINSMGWLGILVATGGVAFVLIEGGIHHDSDFSGLSTAQILSGVGAGLGASVAIATSYVFLKQGLIQGLDPIWASFLRMGVGGCAIWVFALVRGDLFRIMRGSWSSWRVMRVLLLGCAVSSVGNCLAPVAFGLAPAGIVATLIALQPIMIILAVALVDRKFPSGHAIIGTLIAFSGTALIFLR